VVIENGSIAEGVRELVPAGVDRVLDLVGNSVLRDSLQAVRAMGRVCQAGFLGGLGPVDEFQPIFDMPSGAQFIAEAHRVMDGGEALGKLVVAGV
jgi:NADPH:quinone reductase